MVVPKGGYIQRINVEIHGYKMNDLAACEIRTDVGNILQKLGFSQWAITTIIDSVAYSCATLRQPAPFLRIYDSDRETGHRIARALCKELPEMDIEVSILDGFIPATENPE